MLTFERTSSPTFALAAALDAAGAAEPIRAARALFVLFAESPEWHNAAHNVMVLRAARDNPAGIRETLTGVDTLRLWSFLARMAAAGATATELVNLLTDGACPPMVEGA